MTIYVDRAVLEKKRRGCCPTSKKRKRKLYCHMISDSLDSSELLQMASKLQLTQHIQDAKTHHEHFDLSEELRNKAIEFGAIPLRMKEFYNIMKSKQKELL
jgi:hypothetical protein